MSDHKKDPNVIRAEILTKKYPDKKALDNLTFTIQGSSITGLIGRNGAGKTTLMKLCAGLLTPTAGCLEIFGEPPGNNLKVLTRIVYACHDQPHDKNLRLRNVLSNYQIMFPVFDREFADKLVSFFRLNPKAKYGTLSQGMSSVFNFICGLACRAPVTLFDEPVLGMDAATRKSLYEVLLRDYNEYPRLILISSHLLTEIEGYLSDILLIDKGRLVWHGNIDDLRQSAYRLQGNVDVLESFCAGKHVLYQKHGVTDNIAVVREHPDDETVQEAAAAGLTLSVVRPEDLCLYLTQDTTEEELECLWEKTN
ncbi:MAG: ABC transporter ATP-binding protein [Peptococcaceae bacterium]|nr:ABC transporter ATP-binding protein [Peptococcaceae bacterium]